MVTVSPAIRGKRSGPSRVYHEITFEQDAPRPSFIRFQNFYAADICIKQRTMSSHPRGMPIRGPKGEAALKHVWKRVYSRTLMESPHYEDDAQDWHTVSVADFAPGCYEPGQLSVLRIYLHQPSPNWATFELRHVQVFAGGNPAASGAACATAPHQLPAQNPPLERGGRRTGHGLLVESGASTSERQEEVGRGGGSGGHGDGGDAGTMAAGGAESAAGSTWGMPLSGSGGGAGGGDVKGRSGGAGASLSARLDAMWTAARAAEAQLNAFRAAEGTVPNPLQSIKMQPVNSAVEVRLAR